MIPLLQPKEITVRGIQFTIGKFPATVGRDIFRMYIEANKNPEYNQKNEEEMNSKIMRYVGRKIDGRDQLLILDNIDLINNHVVSEYPVQIYLELLMEVINYNFDFFSDGQS